MIPQGKPVYYVIAEQDRTVTRYSVFNLLAVVEDTLENFDAVYNQYIIPYQNTNTYRYVTCFIFNRVPEEFVELTRKVQVGKTDMGKTAAMHRQIENARVHGIDVHVLETKEKQESEVPYHERVWNE